MEGPVIYAPGWVGRDANSWYPLWTCFTAHKTGTEVWSIVEAGIWQCCQNGLIHQAQGRNDEIRNKPDWDDIFAL